MKKIFFQLLLLAFLATGCSGDPDQAPDAYVRFRNTSDSNLIYGLRLGYAVHNGPLPINAITKYYATPPGVYDFLGKTNYGWNEHYLSNLLVESGSSYTLTVTGIYPNNNFIYSKD
jgi:hypothetical protein